MESIWNKFHRKKLVRNAMLLKSAAEKSIMSSERRKNLARIHEAIKNLDLSYNFLMKVERGKTLSNTERAKYLSYKLSNYRVKNMDDVHRFKGNDSRIMTNLERLSLTDLDLKKVDLVMNNHESVSLDLSEDSIVYHGPILFKLNSTGAYVGTCDSCEYYNLTILGIEDKLTYYARRGVVLTLQGKVIGFLKLKGERSFLATRSVIDSSGKNILIKGIVYSLHHLFVDRIKGSRINENWGVKSLEDVLTKVREEYGEDFSRVAFDAQRFIGDMRIIAHLTNLNKEFDSLVVEETQET